MLWPVVLPFQITLVLMAVLAFAIAMIGPNRGWTRLQTGVAIILFPLVAFVPSCVGIMSLVDAVRFGQFEYDSFRDVKDLGAERYLPRDATNIKMYKHSNGYYAQYSIGVAEFQAYLGELWEKSGDEWAVKRGERAGEEGPADPAEFGGSFAQLGWKPLLHAMRYQSPREGDGGGATYYYDEQAGIAYQITGYW